MQEHTKAHGMGQRKNKLYMYILAIGNYEKQNLLYGNRRQESTQKQNAEQSYTHVISYMNM